MPRFFDNFLDIDWLNEDDGRVYNLRIQNFKIIILAICRMSNTDLKRCINKYAAKMDLSCIRHYTNG